jgi:hypothetical protein
MIDRQTGRQIDRYFILVFNSDVQEIDIPVKDYLNVFTY